MKKTVNKGKEAIKFLRSAALPVALSLATVSCSTLEKMILNSPPGKMAVSYVEDRFIDSFENGYKIMDFGFLNEKDSSPNKPILLFIHGWSGTAKEVLEEEKNEKISKLSVMRDVFDNRVLLADYPSNNSIEKIFSGVEKPFLDFVNSYSMENNGAKPKIVIAGHSLGSQLARMFARKYPEYIKKVGIIAGVNDGVNLGVFANSVKEFFPKQVENILTKNEKPNNKDNYQSMEDLITGSDFLKSLNTETAPLDIEYNFYAFVSNKDNFFIPGEDDAVVGLESSYPYRLIKEKRFENIKIGDAIIIREDVNHFSLNNPRLFEIILTSLKSEKQEYLKTLPKPENALQMIIP